MPALFINWRKEKSEKSVGCQPQSDAVPTINQPINQQRMEQKHSMIFNDLDIIDNQTTDRSAIRASVGLPEDGPPPYDTNVRAFTQRSLRLTPAAARHFRPTIPIVIEQTSFSLPCYTQAANGATSIDGNPTEMSQTPTTQPKLGPNPCTIVCPACGNQSTTRMTYTPNTRTHAYAGALCLIGWCCLACCLPYWMKSCRTGNHYCANCNTFLGTHYPFDRT